MVSIVWSSITALVVMSTLVPDVALQATTDYDYESFLNEISDVLPDIANKEQIRKMQSVVDAYRAEKADRSEVDTNALINTKYRTWKRNADLINSLLALPKEMNDAGR